MIMIVVRYTVKQFDICTLNDNFINNLMKEDNKGTDQSVHYENMPVQYIEIFKVVKNVKFSVETF